ncbi:MAG: DUF2079 domain-containing protein, partial [Patescibacteria group bacterium]
MVKLLMSLMIAVYILYFSIFSVLRYQKMQANYFDLGIMHQGVYNSYQAVRTGDWNRFLEITDPIGPNQINRMAVHNDPLLALFVPFYFISPSPIWLLIIQSIVLGLGAFAVFGISNHVLKNTKNVSFISLLFALCYLLYFPMQYANRFDFHAVVLSTSFLLFMFYFWLVKNYRWSFVFLILSLISKEQVGLTTAMMGVYMLAIQNLKSKVQNYNSKLKTLKYPISVILVSVVWVALSFFVIIPYFRGAEHFASSRYENINVISTLFRESTYRYFWFLLGPLGFLSLFSPIHLLIAAPEFVINLLSQESNMRNIVFHYTSVIQ